MWDPKTSCSCDVCYCGPNCQCTETLCRCEASSILNSLGIEAERAPPSSTAASVTATHSKSCCASKAAEPDVFSPTKAAVDSMIVASGTQKYVDPLADPAIPPSSNIKDVESQQQPTIDVTTATQTQPSQPAPTQTVEFVIEGMSCAMCSSAIQKALKDNSNTQQATVSLATDSARVVYIHSEACNVDTLKSAIEDIGFDVVDVIVLASNHDTANNHATAPSPPSSSVHKDAPPTTKTVDLVIDGMTCTMCTNAIQNALTALGGVHAVDVSLATDTARVECDCDVSNEALKETVEDIGFDVVDVIPIASASASSHRDDGGDRQQHPSSSSSPSSPASQSAARAQMQMGPEERLQRLLKRQQDAMVAKKRAFLWSLVGTLPILALTMVVPYVLPKSSPVRRFLSQSVTVGGRAFLLEAVVLCVLCTPVQFGCGFPFLKSSYYGIFVHRVLGMDVLVAIGTLASYAYAMTATWQGTHEYHFFETSAVLICFVLLGKWMNALAVRRTSEALTHLMRLQAKTAIRVTPIVAAQAQEQEQVLTQVSAQAQSHSQPHTSPQPPPSTTPRKTSTPPTAWNPIQHPYQEEVVPIQIVKPQDMVKVLKGASIPADGVLRHGEMSVDESMITGESVPVLKTPGSIVLGGTVCVETGTGMMSKNTNMDMGESVIVGVSTSSSVPTTTMTNHGAGVAAGAFVEVTGVGSSTALSKIIEMVQGAQSRQVPIQSFADTISSYFVPSIIGISVLTFMVWYGLCSSGVVPSSWYEGESATTFSLMFALACLVISCPCALGLATPTAVMVGTGVGAKHGILMKGGETLEVASEADAVVFDKTGTLTVGKPTLTDFVRLVPDDHLDHVHPAIDGDGQRLEQYLLWLLGSLERNSEHPLATAVVAYAESVLEQASAAASVSTSALSSEAETTSHSLSQSQAQPLALPSFVQPTDFQALTGRGASGAISIAGAVGNSSSDASNDANAADDSKNTNNTSATTTTTSITVSAGNRAFMQHLCIDVPGKAEDAMQELERTGKTAILAAVDGQVCAVLGIADQLKEDACRSIAFLRSKGIDVWMVTGDNRRTARSIARQLELPSDRVIAEALPIAKVEQVKKLQGEGLVVVMVGDGVNDSPALAEADVGMSLGSGAEIATEASDIVLVRGNVLDVCCALDLSRVIFNRIKLNLVLSLVYNTLAIPIAAGVLYPLIRTRLPPTTAALVMALSSISVVSSSVSLKLYKPPKISGQESASHQRNQQDGSNRSQRRPGRGAENDLTEPLLSSS